MRLVSALTSACLAIVMLFGAATASFAEEAGTHAWAIKPLILASGPGRSYDVTGHIASETAIKVLRCQRDWCLVSAERQRGWASIHYVDFGRNPAPIITHGGAGEVCFFSGTNFTGTSSCFSGSQSVDDLALLNLDNNFASVQLNGRTSISVCRDRFFKSYCERIVRSEPALNTYLRGNVSSIRIH